MDSRRAETLEALEAFIQAQKDLLEKTVADIDRLRQVKHDALCNPESFSDLNTKLDNAAYRLSAPSDWNSVPNGIDWSFFEGQDPAELQQFTLETQQAFAARYEPHIKQRSPLSELQELVKTARCAIVDPVLAVFANMSEPESDSDAELDPMQVRREREREKLRKLRNRRTHVCGLQLPRLRVEGSDAVFIRHDLEDESMDVDITMDNDEPGACNGHASEPDITGEKVKPDKLSQARQSTRRQVEHSSFDTRPRKKTRKDSLAIVEASAAKDDAKSPELTKNGKPKPETYKQAWSVSEQHLLEQLLEQIPEGEKYRWQKISRAMNGRRTPRQVASRVQKYFEKLKKYGLDGHSATTTGEGIGEA